MNAFNALHHRPFALLWTGQTVSRLGDSLYSIALAWWVLQETGSATIMGTVLTITFVPLLIFLLVGGVAVDRFPRLNVMLASDLLSGAVVTVVAVLAAMDQLAVWHVFVASGIFGFVSAFFEPAYVAAVPDLVPADKLPSANSLTSLSGQFVRVGGPALGAAMIAAGGTSLAFALNAASFFVSAACLLPLLRRSSLPPAAQEAHSVLHDVRDGFGTVIGSPWLWITIALASLGNITWAGPMGVALPFLVQDRFGANVGALGILQSMLALGAVLGALSLGRASRLRRRGLLAYGGLIAGSMALIIYGLPIALVGVALAALVCGGASACFGLVWTNTLQEMVPRERLGRVSSIDMLGSFALLPVGYGIVGWMTEQIGAPLVFVVCGIIGAALAALGLLHPAIRHLD